MNKRFSYRFQTILNLKEKDEDNKKIILGNALKELQTENHRLNQLLEKRHQLENKWRQLNCEKISVKEMQTFGERMNFFSSAIKQQNCVVDNCEKQVTNCRLQLVEARKQTKIHNKLKEKEQDLYNYQLLKNEEALLDQLITYKSASKQGG